jgi:hypothetical protein
VQARPDATVFDGRFALAMSPIDTAKRAAAREPTAESRDKTRRKTDSPYERYASSAWANKMPTLRTTRNAATTSKNMGQPRVQMGSIRCLVKIRPVLHSQKYSMMAR